MSGASVPSRDGRPRQTIAEVQTRLEVKGELTQRADVAANHGVHRMGYRLLHPHEVLKRYGSNEADA